LNKLTAHLFQPKNNISCATVVKSYVSTNLVTKTLKLSGKHQLKYYLVCPCLGRPNILSLCKCYNLYGLYGLFHATISMVYSMVQSLWSIPCNYLYGLFHLHGTISMVYSISMVQSLWSIPCYNLYGLFQSRAEDQPRDTSGSGWNGTRRSGRSTTGNSSKF